MTLAKTFKIALFSLLGLSAVHGPAAAQADAPLLAKVPPGTVLTIGDPVTQKALEVSGLDKELDEPSRLREALTVADRQNRQLADPVQAVS